MVKCLPEFEYFTVFLKNKNNIFKIRRSKVTDYAALRQNQSSKKGILIYAMDHPKLIVSNQKEKFFSA